MSEMAGMFWRELGHRLQGLNLLNWMLVAWVLLSLVCVMAGGAGLWWKP
jgi:hypothetical protein